MPSPWKIVTTNQTFTVLLGDIKGQVNNGGLSKLNDLLNYLATIAQSGTTISLADLEYMKIINNVCVGFFPNNNTPSNIPETFDWNSINTTYIIDLVGELEANLI